MRPRSIGRQLTLGLFLALAGLTALGDAAIYFAVREALYAQFDAGLRVKALVVITATEQRGGRIEVEFSDRFLREFDDDVATDFFQVWSAGGETIERSDSLGRRDLPQRFGTTEKPAYWNLTLPGRDRPGRAIGIKFSPRVDGGDNRARATPVDAIVVVAGRRGELEAMLRRIAWILAAGGAGLLTAMSFTVPWVLRRGLRPLRRVADQAAAIDASTLGQRFPADQMPAELQPICERLNALLARLESSFERERRFSADLAHELLTPLAELRALDESALKWPETAGPETQRQGLEILGRMEELVTRLLDLCRAENGRLPPSLTRLDLAEAVREGWRPFAVAAELKRLRADLAGPTAAGVATDAALLRVVLGNLFSNAVEYAPADTAVRVEWKIADGEFAVSVSNLAPQLEAGDVAVMFDRFWRKDAARSGGQHSGLGLALARELARVLGGRLDGTLAPDGVLTVTFTQPVSAPAA